MCAEHSFRIHQRAWGNNEVLASYLDHGHAVQDHDPFVDQFCSVGRHVDMSRQAIRCAEFDES